MKVYELLENKMDRMSERDYAKFTAALGYQFGLVLKASGITDLNTIDKEMLLTAMMDQDIGELSNGVLYMVCDSSAVRKKLFG